MFLAKLGQDTLAASALVSWLYGTFAVSLFGILGFINLLVSYKHSSKDIFPAKLAGYTGAPPSPILISIIALIFWMFHHGNHD